MNYTDPIIIYLAVGAPVAMHRFFQLERPIRLRTLLIVGFTLLAWPLEAFRIISRHRDRKFAEHSYTLTRENSPETIIAAAEIFEAEILEAAGSFRSSVRSSQAEALDRYIGLAAIHASGVPLAGTSAREFLSAAGSRDQMIGARCLIRRNRLVLERHLNRARGDILKEFGFNGGSPDSPIVRSHLLGLAGVMNDGALTAALADLPAGSNKEAVSWRPSSGSKNNSGSIPQPQATV
ncbi:MAG TPA: hypothetical protein VK918_02135 [Pyrinomonadaceae bacterium]|nr:hypothetical protein [Pyrinomonadaceae bacterium]